MKFFRKALFFLIILSGCAEISPSNQSSHLQFAPALSVFTHWNKYDNQADGILISLPDTWKITNLSESKASWVKNIKNAKLFAEDHAPEASTDGRIAFMVIQGFTIPKNETAASFLETYVSKPLEKFSPSREVVSLPSGETTLFRFSIDLKSNPLGISKLSNFQYFLANNKKAFVVSFSTADFQASDYAYTFDQIVRTFQIQ